MIVSAVSNFSVSNEFYYRNFTSVIELLDKIRVTDVLWNYLRSRWHDVKWYMLIAHTWDCTRTWEATKESNIRNRTKETRNAKSITFDVTIQYFLLRLNYYISKHNARAREDEKGMHTFAKGLQFGEKWTKTAIYDASITNINRKENN